MALPAGTVGQRRYWGRVGATVAGAEAGHPRRGRRGDGAADHTDDPRLRSRWRADRLEGGLAPLPPWPLMHSRQVIGQNARRTLVISENAADTHRLTCCAAYTSAM